MIRRGINSFHEDHGKGIQIESKGSKFSSHGGIGKKKIVKRRADAPGTLGYSRKSPSVSNITSKSTGYLSIFVYRKVTPSKQESSRKSWGVSQESADLNI